MNGKAGDDNPGWRKVAGGSIPEAESRTEVAARADALARLLWDLFDALPIGLFVLDNRTGRIVRVNREVSRLVQLSAEECVGLPYEAFVAAEDLQRVRDYRARRLAGDPTLPRSYELLLTNRFGDRRVAMFHADLVKLEDVMVGALVDITDQKLSVDPLTHVQKLESLSTLAGGVANEFNNQLAVISGYAQLALSRAAAQPGLEEPLQRIQAAARDAARHVQALLSFARKGASAMESVDVAALVASVVAVLSSMFSKPMAVRVRQSDEACFVRGDSSRLEQAFLNVLVNAVEALPAEGGEVEVAVHPVPGGGWNGHAASAAVEGELVAVEVGDNGVGIPVEVLPRVMQPFFTTKGSTGHPGLGLSVAHGIAREHGGAVHVESTLGRGTRVTFYLPREREPSALVPAMLKDFDPGAARRLVLVVDDQEAVAELVCDVLSSIGYHARFEINPTLALARVKSGEIKPDAIIVDICMPGLDGRAFIRELRLVDTRVAIVAISGYVNPQEDDAEVAAMTSGFVHKPFEVREVAALMKQVFDAQKDKEDQ